MSIIEVLITGAISMVILLGSVFVFQVAAENQSSLMEKISSEEDVNSAALILRQYFSMAVNLTQANSPGPLNTATFDRNLGQASTYNLSNWTSSTGPGAVDTIAFFVRENLRSGSSATPTALTDRFPITTIFFQRPTVDRYGVLYIGSSAGAPANLRPSDGDLKISRVVDFAVIDVFSQPFMQVGGYALDADLAGRNMITALTLRVVTRNYFGVGTSGKRMTWCPPDFMPQGALQDATCDPQLPYKDTQKTFTFNIRNNVLGRSQSQRGVSQWTVTPGAAGPPAPHYRRPFDSVYFLTPNMPIGNLTR